MNLPWMNRLNTKKIKQLNETFEFDMHGLRLNDAQTDFFAIYRNLLPSNIPFRIQHGRGLSGRNRFVIKTWLIEFIEFQQSKNRLNYSCLTDDITLIAPIDTLLPLPSEIQRRIDQAIERMRDPSVWS